MHTYNTAPPVDQLQRAQTELMVQNVERVLSRGQRIELLLSRQNGWARRSGARSVRRQMWWKNTLKGHGVVCDGRVGESLFFATFWWG
ncbi:hypothetical protein FB45DRAFT_900669 [Roridomyces roridus]|uniref:V-SNARE coiled-coil homology domain-containing protein n=1 Tax=Roridomyces roridus TaxID=1738132 RepID=A0AAD7FWF2_9AGAR|nr:hypothetical protein FB45DRAFT_900669 [Roridomyces roridus]